MLSEVASLFQSASPAFCFITRAVNFFRALLFGTALIVVAVLASRGFHRFFDDAPPDEVDLDSITLSKGATVGEAFGLDLDGDAKTDFLFSEYFPKEPTKRGRVRIFRQTTDQRFEEITETHLGLVEVFHLRDLKLIDVNGDGFSDILLADHGPDVPPYPGASPRLLIQTHQGHYKDETEQRLPKLSDFTFNIVKIDVNVDGSPDIYLSNVKGGTSQPRLLINNQKGFFKEESWRLPKELTSKQICSMAALSVSFQKSTLRDLVIGGCDRRENGEGDSRDRALKIEKGKLVLLPPETLPKRYLDSTWGTVHIQPLPQADGNTDLLVATHPPGFDQGAVQIYKQTTGADGILKFEAGPLIWKSAQQLPIFVQWMWKLGVDDNPSHWILETREANSLKKPYFDRNRIFRLTPEEAFDKTAELNPILRRFGGHTIPINSGAVLFIEYSGKMRRLTALHHRESP